MSFMFIAYMYLETTSTYCYQIVIFIEYFCWPNKKHREIAFLVHFFSTPKT